MKRISFLILLLMGMIFPTDGWAHRVGVFAWREGKKIHVEGFFSDGTPTKGAKVEVFSGEGKKLLEGRTDEEGTFSFDAPKEGELRIILWASMGHRAETKVLASDAEETPQEEPLPSSPLSSDELRKVVEEAVAKEVRPLMKMIA